MTDLLQYLEKSTSRVYLSPRDLTFNADTLESKYLSDNAASAVHQPQELFCRADKLKIIFARISSSRHPSSTTSTAAMGTGKKEANRKKKEGKVDDGFGNVKVKGENFYRYAVTL